jgi:hypothetical protein
MTPLKVRTATNLEVEADQVLKYKGGELVIGDPKKKRTIMKIPRYLRIAKEMQGKHRKNVNGET